jgi:septum formation protein
VATFKQARALVLASASPRRRDILGSLGVTFRVLPSGIDESALPHETPEAHVRRLSIEKAAEVRARLAGDPERPWVFAADTIVVIDGAILGKPRDDADAQRMLLQLSRRTHRVLTAIHLCEVGSARERGQTLETAVQFRSLDERAAAAYVASGEGRDKAGSYAIQGLGAGLVRSINGSYTNVVGMPAAETLDLLLWAGVIEDWP